MNKILIIGVGSAGRNSVEKMKEVGIPNANYISIGNDADVDNEQGIPHYSLAELNGFSTFHITDNPKELAKLAENAKRKIREIIKQHI